MDGEEVTSSELKDSVELEIPASLEYLAVVRDVVAAAVARSARVSQDRLDDLRVAVSEAVTNSMNALSSLGSRSPIRVCCIPRKGRVEVSIVDRGGGFNPGGLEQLPEPDDPQRMQHESGLGISLMRTMVDEHSIRPSGSSGEGTEVRLVVYC